MESEPEICRKNKIKFQTQIVLLLFLLPACIEHTLIPGQIEQQGQISRRIAPNHRDVLRGGLLKQKIASQKLVDRVRFLAFYPLHLIAMGNFVEQGEFEKSLPLFEENNIVFVSKNRRKREVKKMLTSEDSNARELAAGLVEQKENLLISLYNKDDYVRLAAIYKLRKYKFQEIEPHLFKLLNDPNKFVRLETVRILRFFSAKKVLIYIYQSLRDLSSMVRGEAVVTLNALKNIASVEKLWPMLNDSETYVRKKAIEAIENLTKISIHFPYNASEKLRTQKIELWKKKWLNMK
ncbi:HEAT repeat domain-containing protein [Candidatus Uabimicrobium sp. HlEnr_7]|uniref:HEAT repeat domain-containing protein n=1 Tax=Candidatus Uabimicrobium helgolandensis TaxID=3095367 RepID=UPI0035588EAB